MDCFARYEAVNDESKLPRTVLHNSNKSISCQVGMNKSRQHRVGFLQAGVQRCLFRSHDCAKIQWLALARNVSMAIGWGDFHASPWLKLKIVIFNSQKRSWTSSFFSYWIIQVCYLSRNHTAAYVASEIILSVSAVVISSFETSCHISMFFFSKLTKNLFLEV